MKYSRQSSRFGCWDLEGSAPGWAYPPRSNKTEHKHGSTAQVKSYTRHEYTTEEKGEKKQQGNAATVHRSQTKEPPEANKRRRLADDAVVLHAACVCAPESLESIQMDKTTGNTHTYATLQGRCGGD
nr:unnamed protein product [Digitaria exilis]